MHSPIPVGRRRGQVGRAAGTVQVSSSPVQAASSSQVVISPFGFQQNPWTFQQQTTWPFQQQVPFTVQQPVVVQQQFQPVQFQQAPYDLPQWDLRNLQFVLDAIHAARQALSVGDMKAVVNFLLTITQKAQEWFGIGLRQAQTVSTEPANVNQLLLGIETNLNLARRESASGAGWSALNQAVVWANDVAGSLAARYGYSYSV